MRKLQGFTLFLMIAVLFGSCALSEKVAENGPIQKRKYRSGWHLNGGRSDDGTLADKEASDQDRPLKPVPKADVAPQASGPYPKLDHEYAPTSIGSEKDTGDCDRIIKRDGEEIEAEVKTVGSEKIRYKKCGREDGPTYTIEKDEVFMIKYPGGEKDVFEKERSSDPEEEEESEASEEEAPESSSPSSDESDGPGALGIIGFVFAILALIFAPLALLAGAAGLFWSAIGMSLVGFILSLVGDSGLATAGAIINGLVLFAGILILGIGIALLATI